MRYFLIMLLAIFITTILVFMLANRGLGINLRWKPLILCAVCSMVISLVLPHVVGGIADLPGSVAMLAAFAVVFAYFVAKYDVYDEQKAIAGTYEKGLPLDECVLAVAEDVAVHQNIGNIEEAADESTEQQAIERQLDVMPEASECSVVAESVHIVATYNNQDIDGLDQQLSPDIAAVNFNEQFDEISAEFEAAAEGTVDDTAMAEEQTVQKQTIEEIMLLDDLMDFAFKQKENKNFQQALASFRKALDLYPDSDSAPFIAIEMGNILKNKGAYDEAIQIFSEGRNLHALQSDDLLEQEFVSTIAYLRIVKNILLAQRLGFIPYNEIPGAVFAEINAEFCEWRNLA